MRFIILPLLLACAQTAPAQEATTAASGTGNLRETIYMDWSVGELTLVNTVQNGALVLSQGFLQGTMTPRSQSGGLFEGEIIIFPNPTGGPLSVQTGFFEPGELTLVLYDAQGRQLIQQTAAVNSFGIRNMDLTRFASGMYLLQAFFKSTSGETRKGSFKIARL